MERCPKEHQKHWRAKVSVASGDKEYTLREESSPLPVKGEEIIIPFHILGTILMMTVKVLNIFRQILHLQYLQDLPPNQTKPNQTCNHQSGQFNQPPKLYPLRYRYNLLLHLPCN